MVSCRVRFDIYRHSRDILLFHKELPFLLTEAKKRDEAFAWVIGSIICILSAVDDRFVSKQQTRFQTSVSFLFWKSVVWIGELLPRHQNRYNRTCWPKRNYMLLSILSRVSCHISQKAQWRCHYAAWRETRDARRAKDARRSDMRWVVLLSYVSCLRTSHVSRLSSHVTIRH